MPPLTGIKAIEVGLGQHIDMALMDVMVGALANQPMEPAVRLIEEFACTDEERHALCHGDAERVFYILRV